jgi:hypothetical protein
MIVQTLNFIIVLFPHISTWIYILTLDILRAFHLRFLYLWLYIDNFILFDVKWLFKFPLDCLLGSLWCDRHLLLLLPQWCLVWPKWWASCAERNLNLTQVFFNKSSKKLARGIFHTSSSLGDILIWWPFPNMTP